jgi:hypothetical protein
VRKTVKKVKEEKLSTSIRKKADKEEKVENITAFHSISAT